MNTCSVSIISGARYKREKDYNYNQQRLNYDLPSFLDNSLYLMGEEK